MCCVPVMSRMMVIPGAGATSMSPLHVLSALITLTYDTIHALTAVKSGAHEITDVPVDDCDPVDEMCDPVDDTRDPVDDDTRDSADDDGDVEDTCTPVDDGDDVEDTCTSVDEDGDDVEDTCTPVDDEEDEPIDDDDTCIPVDDEEDETIDDDDTCIPVEEEDTPSDDDTCPVDECDSPVDEDDGQGKVYKLMSGMMIMSPFSSISVVPRDKNRPCTVEAVKAAEEPVVITVPTKFREMIETVPETSQYTCAPDARDPVGSFLRMVMTLITVSDPPI
jgi:hypothetical protein